jgi:hypothetical protein
MQVDELVAKLYGDTGNTNDALVESATALKALNKAQKVPGSQGAGTAGIGAEQPLPKRGRPPGSKNRVASAPTDGHLAKGLEGRLGTAGQELGGSQPGAYTFLRDKL